MPRLRAAQELAHGLDPWVDDDCLQELRWVEPALGPAFGQTRDSAASSVKRVGISRLG
jgi:hypothetical protein